MQSLPMWLASWFGLGGGQSPPATSPDSQSDPAAEAPAAAERAASAPALPSPPAAEIPDGWNATTAVELIARLMDLTSTVANEVENHSGHIESINDELSGVKQGDSAAVAAVVCKLLVINQETQRRLERAELKLQAQQRQIQDVSTAARIDGLTGLVNRRTLDEAIRRCLADFQRKGRCATMLLLDVDHFKQFNDSHGHVAGDEALKHVADILRSQARETDVVARFGGEEFVIIFNGASLSAVKQRAEKARSAIGSKPVLVGEQQFFISTSAGMAEIREQDDEQEWIKRADAALYAAKNSGRDCLYVDEGGQPQRYVARTEDPTAGNHEPRVDRRRVSTDLAAEAFTDATFLSAVSRRIAEWRRGGSAFSVMLARLDRTDELVRDHGPEALQTAVKALTQLARASVRDMDQPTRWTADGLAVLLPGALVTDAANIARRLLEVAEKYELPLPGGSVRLSLSMGVAEVIEGNDAQRLLERALGALDAVRHSGGGRVFVHDGLQTAAAPAHHLAGA